MRCVESLKKRQPFFFEISANGSPIQITGACILLDRQIKAQRKCFENEGGSSERMYRRRTENRKKSARTEVTIDTSDLGISATDSPDPVIAGEALSYAVYVTNNGPAAATSVEVTDTLPAATAFVSASGTGWTCSEAGGTVTCERDSLAVDETSRIAIEVTAPSQAGFIENTVSVTAAEQDPDTGNNEASARTEVTIDTSDLSIASDVTPDPVKTGENFTCNVDVTNNGPSAATSVEVTNTLPAGTVFISASGAGWACSESSGIVTCERDTLAVDETSRIAIEATAPSPTPSPWRRRNRTPMQAATKRPWKRM